MGNTYTRQSSYSDGDVITAAHTNDEFNQLLAAFASGTGHTHDGTTAEGGPITKLLGTSLTFGDGTAGTDITVTFDGETSDGVLKWMEDEDYFEFSDDILVASTEKLQFRDTAIYINSSTDGQLDIVADTEVQIAATTIDMNGNADVSGTLTYGSLSDGSITITAFVDEDDMSSNSATLVPTQQSVKAYVDTQLTAEDLDFQADSGGALSIDLDSETLTFTGGTGIDTSGSGNAVTFAIDSTVATLADTQTFTNKTLTSPKINENVAVSATATELNIMDGGTSATSTTLADADRVVVNDAGTMKQVALTDFETYFESALDTLSNVTTVGTLNSGAISSGFGAIDIGSSNLTATGTVSLGATSFNDNNITNVGDIAVDSISADATDINIAVSDNSATAFTIKQGSDNYFVVDTGNSSESIAIGTGISGTAITLGHSTSEVTVADNLTVTGDLTVSGTTTTVNSTTVNLNDHNIVLDSGNSTSAVINGAGITIEGGSGDDATFTYNTTGPQFELKLGSSFEDLQTAKLTASELDISGDVDVDGTLEADAITVNGTALNTVIAGVTVANATTAAVATTVTISDNESTNEDNAIIFTSGGDVDGGNIGLESDGDLTYNPSTGRLTATQLAGTLQTAAQANVTSLGTLTTLTVDNVIINGSTIGHTGDTDLMTVASGVLTVAGEVDATSLDISGDADIDGTLEADAITVNGATLNSVIADEAVALAIALG